ncbi:hypothetical protein J7J90_02885 [Candidatus Micrarchaeota archaeon]|nr:hypothetical protein [Candidatus Micrarchaeota archaeon]
MKRIIYILTKPEVLVLFLLVFGVVLVVFLYPNEKTYTKEDVRAMILDDLANKYPASQYNNSVEYGILEVNKTENGWYVKAKVSLYNNTPCPELVHLVYNYPKTNFVPEPPKRIVYDCVPCYDYTKCTLLFKEQAIIASHTLPGTEKVKSFLVSNPHAVPSVLHPSGYWIVTWHGENETVVVNMSENGTVLNVR